MTIGSRARWWRRWGVGDVATFAVYVVLTTWAVLSLFPIYWMIKNSFEPNQLLSIWPPRILPYWEKLTLSNYDFLIRKFPMVRWFFNSSVVAVARTAGVIFFASLAGYAFAKLRFFGREAIFWALMGVLMLPGFVMIIPQYQLIRAFGWYNTFWALIVPGLTGGVGAVFLMRQFIRVLPSELIEAARMDGAREFTIFLKVIAPLAAPGMAVLGIMWFIGNWNSFLWPVIATNTKEMRTLPPGLAFLVSPLDSGTRSPTGQLMAGASLAAIPMIIVFLFFQRYFLKGITVGAIKG